MINTHNGIKEKGVKPIDIDHYPAIKKHLDQFLPRLAKRADKGVTPYNLRNCAYMDDFSRQKIVWGEISDRTKFSFDLGGDFVTEATTFLMVGESLLYLGAVLNSKLSEYLFSKIGTTTGVGTVRWKKYTIEQMYIPKLRISRQNEYEKKVLQLVDASKNNCDCNLFEEKINQMIYKDLALTKKEISFIESQ